MMLEPQKNSSNWILLLGQLLAQLSDRMLSIGLVWIISKNFGAEKVTWYLVVGGLPHLLFFMLSSNLIRRFGSLNIIITADWVRSIFYLAATVFILAIENQTQLTQVMILIFATNTMAAFFNPSIYSLPIEIETGARVQSLTAKLSTISSISTVIGPIIGIFCFEALGIRGLFFITAAFYSFSGLCAWSLRPRMRKFEQTATEKMKIDHPISPLVFAMLFIFLMMNLLTSPIQILIPSMAQNIFHGSFNALAILESGLGLGISAGGLFLSVFAIRSRALFYTWLFINAVAICFLAFQFSSFVWVASLLLATMGLFVGLANILILNIFQNQYSDSVPRIMSFVNLIGSAAVPVSLVVVAFLQTKFSIFDIAKVTGAGLFVVCLLSWLPFRRWGKEVF